MTVFRKSDGPLEDTGTELLQGSCVNCTIFQQTTVTTYNSRLQCNTSLTESLLGSKYLGVELSNWSVSSRESMLPVQVQESPAVTQNGQVVLS